MSVGVGDEDLWLNYFQITRQAGSGWDTSLTTAYCVQSEGGTITYNRALINGGKDDGVDPYGAAWAIYNYINPAGGSLPIHYYHVHIYRDGSLATGYDFATRELSVQLSQFKQPVGTLVDEGGHYVLSVGVISDRDPAADEWGAVITKVYVRDPWNVLGGSPGQLVEYDTGATSPWAAHFDRYGYNASGGYVPPPNCPNCRDDAHGYANPPVWWGDYVIVTRDNNANDPDYIFYYQH